MKEICRHETEYKEIKKLVIESMKHDRFELISDLNLEQILITKKIKGTEIKLKKLGVSEKIISTIKRSLFAHVVCEIYGLYNIYSE